jgi:SAM-dependent methyltransferase
MPAPRALLPALAALLLAACNPTPAAPAPRTTDTPTSETHRFPAPDRPVAGIVSDQWSDEESRDDEGEVADVVRLAGIRPGQTVADIGAGSGYYTVRLSPIVGPKGRILATDIIPDYLNRLKARVAERGLANVSLVLGDPGNPRLPAASTDVALMVHMYHEIEDPFGLLWHLHESLRPGAPRPDGTPSNGLVAIIDADRPTARHGTPPALLKCELEAVGYRQIAFHPLQGNYLALFERGPRPAPEAIKPCRL